MRRQLCRKKTVISRTQRRKSRVAEGANVATVASTTEKIRKAQKKQRRNTSKSVRGESHIPHDNTSNLNYEPVPARYNDLSTNTITAVRPVVDFHASIYDRCKSRHGRSRRRKWPPEGTTATFAATFALKPRSYKLGTLPTEMYSN